jgi:uncharacterized protein with NAD-binding domain and iron-sulfur cluster
VTTAGRKGDNDDVGDETDMVIDAGGVSRRTFLAGLGATGAASALRPTSAWGAPAASVSTQVAILGGGVGGLTAAHELAERGIRVTVFEPKALGGKARSIPVPGTGTGGRLDLPGEHGFRFFPGFYKNTTDSMSRIPDGTGDGSVLDHLLDANQEMFVLPSGQAWLLPTFNQVGFAQGIRSVITTIGLAASVPANELAYLVRKMLVFQTSSDARRIAEWDNVSWWDFVNAGRFSPTYQQVFGNGLTKTLVAAKGTRASARTIGLMGLALIYSLLSHNNPLISSQSGYGAADRLLDAPTNEAWIDPWVAHLRGLGVTFVEGYSATKLHVDGNRIASATLTSDQGGSLEVRADHFVAAMPVERARVLFDPAVRAAAPELAALDQLEYDFMNGIQFFLNKKPTQGVRGHVAFLSSPWALTSIDQGVFWDRDLATTYGDGQLRDILSVDISDFFAPGILYGKAAVDCTADEIAAECWAQVKAGLNSPLDTQVSDDMLLDWFLDPALVFGSGPVGSSEPLLINTPGALALRPTATTSIPNLFLAADYVRCDVDLATMEGANEAARAATNGILDAIGSNEPRAQIGTLWEAPIWDLNKQTDQQRFTRGQPNLLDTLPAGLRI